MLKIVDDMLRLAFVALFGFILFCVGVAPVHPSSYTEWGVRAKKYVRTALVYFKG